MHRVLLRMSRWARNPPSKKRARMVLMVIAICLLVYAIERMGWWPDWARAQRIRL